MIDITEQLTAVFRTVGDFLRKLKPEELSQLADGTARIVVLPPGATVNPPAVDADQVREALRQLSNRQQGLNYLLKLKLKAADQKALARKLDIAIEAKDNMETVRKKIVNGTVGARLDTATISDRSWAE
jgi:hypothetical protein